MAQKSVIRKDSISEYCITNGTEVRPYFGTMFNDGDPVKIHFFAGTTRVGVGLDGEANFRKDALEGKYEVWGLSGVYTYSTTPGEPIPSKTLSPENKISRIKDYSRYQTTSLRRPYTIEAMNLHIAMTPGDQISPFSGNIVNMCYALSKCKVNSYKPYPGLWEW